MLILWPSTNRMHDECDVDLNSWWQLLKAKIENAVSKHSTLGVKLGSKDHHHFYNSLKIIYVLRWKFEWFTLSKLIIRSGSSTQEYMQYVRTCASFIIMWAKTWRNPTIASHSLLWARDCWLPVQGPWRERLSATHINKTSDHGLIFLICLFTWMYSVRLLKICFATVMALEKFFLPGSSMMSLPE